jgi:tetratricopeptide (TPR) repeat protein
MRTFKHPFCLTGLCLGVFPGLLMAHPGIHVALEQADEAIRQAPREASAYLTRGELYREHGEFDRARKDLFRALELDGSLDFCRLSLGKLFLKDRQPEKAAEQLSLYLQKHPGDDAAWALKGQAALARSDFQSALQDYNRAIRTAARPDPRYFLDRAEVHLAQSPDDLERALKGLEEGIKRVGSLVVLEKRALELEQQHGRHEAILKRLNRLCRKAPLFWLEKKADYLESKGFRQEALAVWREAERQLHRLPAHRLQSPKFSSLVKRAQDKTGALQP